MHILYLHQHFAVPSGSTGTRSYEFAKRWVQAGHKVTVITGHYDIGGLDSTRKKQTIDGVEVVIAGSKYGNNMRFIKRVWTFLSFMLFATIAGIKVNKVDAIYATSTPLTIGVPAILLKWFKNRPFIFEVRDQWPEIPIELEIIKSPILKAVLLWLEKRIYLSSSGIVALSDGMKKGIQKIIGDKKPIEIIPNSCDTEIFHPDINGETLRVARNWKGKFILLHAGAMGKVNSLNFILDVAKTLKNVPKIHFVLVGGGNEKPSLEQRILDEKISNVEIISSVPKTELPMYFAACDVSMVIIGNYPIIEHNSANKFFDSLSAGKPILINYSGWQREILYETKSGFGTDICDIDQFISIVKELSSGGIDLIKMGKNARKTAIEMYNRNKLAKRALDFIITQS